MTYEELVNDLNRHCHLYYDLSKQEITDTEFDALYDKCVKIEEAQGWRHSLSPTVRVGSRAGKIQHVHQLYSLDKVYDPSKVNPIFKIKTPKMDGTNLTITYKNGDLHIGLLRGDGKFGDSVVHLLKYMKDVPSSIDLKGIVTITGECITNNKVENFRNYCSGAMGLKSPEEFKTRSMRFVVHDWLGAEGNYTVKLKLLEAEGFFTVLNEKECNKYPQDGIVYRINDWKTCQELGYTSKFPRFAIALKPIQETASTILQRVEWEVGRTGTVNPVGIVDPVILDDATITRVTLHNIEFIETHKLGLGDEIEIERAGGVIPHFVGIINRSSHNQRITEDDAARAVGDSVTRNGPKLYVCNPEKHGTVKLLHHFIKTLGIKGLGPQSVSKMGLQHPTDLYTSRKWDLLGANGSKIQAEIERSKTKPYSTVLAALGIEGVGRRASEKIVAAVPMFSRIREIEYLSIPTIGPKTIEKILTWLDINEDWVEKLPLQLEQVISIDDILGQSEEKEIKKVCISGKVDMTKSDLTEVLEKFGYTVASSVTKDCYALITAGSPTSKVKKAEQYGIKIIDYWANRNNILNGVL